MFSHIVIFWIKPDVEDAEKRLVDGLNHYLPDIPGVISMHVGRCAPSDRPVVDQSYQVALNITFKNKIVQDEYQASSSSRRCSSKSATGWSCMILGTWN